MSEVRVEEPTCTAVCKVSWLRTCGEDNAIIPSYSLSFSILGLVNTQTENNVCINNVDPNTLTNICQGFADGKLDPNGFTYLTCCSEEFVPSDIGKSHLPEI